MAGGPTDPKYAQMLGSMPMREDPGTDPGMFQQQLEALRARQAALPTTDGGAAGLGGMFGPGGAPPPGGAMMAGLGMGGAGAPPPGGPPGAPPPDVQNAQAKIAMAQRMGEQARAQRAQMPGGGVGPSAARAGVSPQQLAFAQKQARSAAPARPPAAARPAAAPRPVQAARPAAPGRTAAPAAPMRPQRPTRPTRPMGGGGMGGNDIR